jgi:hypothetical protein
MTLKKKPSLAVEVVAEHYERTLDRPEASHVLYQQA